jgi:hypothetical protein
MVDGSGAKTSPALGISALASIGAFEAESPMATGAGPVTVVNYYTLQGPYPAYAERLRESCAALKVPCMSIELEDRGRWVTNCAVKGPFMLQCMRILACPILWIDADAELVAHPDILRDCDADFGVYAFSGERRRTACGRVANLPTEFPDPPRWFNSGTVFINNTTGGMDLLYRWAELCQADDGHWDQWLLQQAWCDTRPTTFWLPQSYCAVRGQCSGKPVITHHLASTQQKGIDRG